MLRPYRPYNWIAMVIGLCLIATLPGRTQGSAWAPLSPEITAESLAAQRKKILELRALFAKIDRRMEDIAKIQQRIEHLIDNREATTACTALDMLRHIEMELVTEVGAAASDAAKAKLQEELAEYRVILVKAKTLTSTLGCRE